MDRSSLGEVLAEEPADLLLSAKQALAAPVKGNDDRDAQRFGINPRRVAVRGASQMVLEGSHDPQAKIPNRGISGTRTILFESP